MPPRIIPKGENIRNGRPKKAGEIRKSQMIGKYGPGALVDFPRLSGIMCGIDDWEKELGSEQFDKMKIYERNLQRILNKKFFIQAETRKNQRRVSGIPAIRFPYYCYCPECGKLDRYFKLTGKPNNNKDFNSDIFCVSCKQKNGRKVKLIPSRFVVACENGHIDDFPYEWWVHKGKEKCANPRLHVVNKGNTGGLEGMIITCECGASASMQGCMDQNALGGCRCYGSMPWLGKGKDGKGWYKDEKPCNARIRTLQRTANNVYYETTESALTIPPFSSKIQQYIQKNRTVLDFLMDRNNSSVLRESGLKSFYMQHEDYLNCDFEKFIQEINYAYDGIEKELTATELIFGEYSALCDEATDEDYFKTIQTEVPKILQPYINQIKIVSRLREVQALTGFRRINPVYQVNSEEWEKNGIFERNCTPISREEKEWLPAIELYGEGIFIELQEQEVFEWEKRNIERYQKMIARYEASYFRDGKISSESVRYVLLHTFSHLLIRQLSEKCGYVSASLKEKIYCSSGLDGNPMCGILIYTAAADADGSLGGLAREGQGYRLGNTILEMLDNASWCSNDPICIDSTSQGFMALNYAACHACVLLPETSCECCNYLLDRAAVVGTPDKWNIGYLSKLLEVYDESDQSTEHKKSESDIDEFDSMLNEIGEVEKAFNRK